MSTQTDSTLNAPAEAPDKGVVCDALVSVFWQTGTPNVTDGGREIFWCATRNSAGKIFHRHLAYLNAHVMPLSDSCYDAPESAVPVGDDGDYAWTGWHQESCDHCETQWSFDDEVVAWMRLPSFNANAKDQPRGRE